MSEETLKAIRAAASPTGPALKAAVEAHEAEALALPTSEVRRVYFDSKLATRLGIRASITLMQFTDGTCARAGSRC